MEMVEEVENQPKISPKRIKFLEIEEKVEIDLISALPDCLILEILSRLPSTKDANRYFDFKPQFSNWIRYAMRYNVEELFLKLYHGSIQLDQFFFINTSFTRLILEGCIFNPTGAICWKNLTSLCISYGKLDEDLIENILSGSPALETLVFKKCYGYRRLDITSKSVKNLVFSGYMVPFDELKADIIEINAPNILSLTILGSLYLWKLLLVNMSSLVKAELDYERLGHYETTHKEAKEEMLKGFILNLRHVKELKIGLHCSKVMSHLEAKGFMSPSNMKFTEDAVYERLAHGIRCDCDLDLVEANDDEVF